MNFDDASEIMHHMPEAQTVNLQTVYMGHWIDIVRLGGKRVRLSIAKGPGTSFEGTDHDNIYAVKWFLGFEYQPMMSVDAMNWHLYLDGRPLEPPSLHFVTAR